MSKVKQILQLTEQGISQREIARRLQINRKTVGEYLSRFNKLGFSKDVLLSISDEELASLFKSHPLPFEDREEYKYLENLFPYFRKELKRVGVTRFILWEEYRLNRPQGYSYSHMCHHYQQWLNSENSTAILDHAYGEEMYIDFTGKVLPYKCATTGRILKAEVFVSILGGSRMFYVEALPTQKVEQFTLAVSNAIEYFKGVPKVLIPDNLKSAVTSASNYQPIINDTFLSMANHYGAVVSPARARKPRDKALVESIINVVYSAVFAPLRNDTPCNLVELNIKIEELVATAVAKNFQNRDYSRKDLFEKYEKEALQPLPTQRYQISKSYKLKVNKSYHVFFSKDRHSYSVPYTFVGKRVKAIVTPRIIAFYYNRKQIASHIRSNKANGFSTLDEHKHPNHRYIDQWEPSIACSWAASIDPAVEVYVGTIMKQVAYPHLARRMYEGIKSLNKKYGKERLTSACKRATFYKVYDYTTLKNILSSNLDKCELPLIINSVKIPSHSNIRGANYYK